MIIGCECSGAGNFVRAYNTRVVICASVVEQSVIGDDQSCAGYADAHGLISDEIIRQRDLTAVIDHDADVVAQVVVGNGVVR